MRMHRFVQVFAIIGMAVPIIFTLSWPILEKTKHWHGTLGNALATLQLLIWPSSIFMMATAGHEGLDFKMLSISIAVNIVLYSIIGFIFWMGLKKHHWLLYVLVVLILLSWYKLLRL